jgi:hypothetical protein
MLKKLNVDYCWWPIIAAVMQPFKFRSVIGFCRLCWALKGLIFKRVREILHAKFIDLINQIFSKVGVTNGVHV